MSAGASVTWGVTGTEESTSEVPHVADAKSGSCALRASPQSIPNMAAGLSWREWHERERSPSALYDLISEVTKFYICILF